MLSVWRCFDSNSSRWNYKVLSDIFVKIELFTYSYSVTIYLHYVMSFVHLGSLLFLCLKETCSPYTFSYMECKKKGKTFHLAAIFETPFRQLFNEQNYSSFLFKWGHIKLSKAIHQAWQCSNHDKKALTKHCQRYRKTDTQYWVLDQKNGLTGNLAALHGGGAEVPRRLHPWISQPVGLNKLSRSLPVCLLVRWL